MSPIEEKMKKAKVIGEICLIVYIYYVLITIFLVLPPILCNAMGFSIGLRVGTTISLTSVAIAELIAFYLIIMFYRKKGIFLSDLGWNVPLNGLLLAASLTVAVLYIWYTIQIPEIRENFTEISFLKLWGLLVGVFGAIVEEIIFRGIVMERLQQAKVSTAGQILLSAIAFCLLHLGFGLIGVICTFSLGIALGVMYVWGKRSIISPIICHGFINAFIEPWLLFWLLQFYAEKFSS